MRGAGRLGMVGLRLAAVLLSLQATFEAWEVSAQGQGIATVEVEEAQKGVEHVRRRAVGDKWSLRQVAPLTTGPAVDVGECILLFGAFCNGNMGDVVQHISMEHLLASVAPKGQCFYYAHSGGEHAARGFRQGDFFGGDKSKLIPLFTDLAWQVNQFKALVIGGGGIFSAKHAPLFKDEFAEVLTVPIIVMGVGANYNAKEFSSILQKATFVSGRDSMSIKTFAGVLRRGDHSAVRPEDVRLVRDPVLSDNVLTDTDGGCWEQSKGGDRQPLCFVLPAADTANTIDMHRQLKNMVVRPGDRFINVFPKHQEEIEKIGYPGTLEDILDPAEYTKQLCSCKAIISTRFHGAILGLHMGVPTFGAFHHSSENKVPDLMINTLSMPEQFFRIDQNLTREVVDREVAAVRRLYDEEGRRGAIHAKLSEFYEEFQAHAHHVLFDVVGLEDTKQEKGVFPQLSLSIATGQDYLVAIFLLFAIVGLALLPSTAKDSGNLRQRPSEDAAVDRVRKAGANGAPVASMDHFRVQKEVDARSSSSAGTSVNSSPRDSEQGVLEERSKAASLIISSHMPRHAFSNGKGMPINASENKRSDVIFVLNFALWIALAVTYSTYSKFYLRNTHDPVGLLVLQGTTGAVILFSLGRLGLGASGISNPPGLLGLPVQPASASRWGTLAAILHASQALLTNVSLFIGGVALTNALKAMEPVAAAVFSYFLLGKSASPASMVSFATIVAGILLLTSKSNGGSSKEVPEGGVGAGGVGEGDHYSRILGSAVFTTAAVCCNALRNVLIKKSDPVPPRQTLFACSLAAGAVGVALMLLRLTTKRMEDLVVGQEDPVAALAAETVPSAGGREVGGDTAHADQYDSWLNMDGVNAALCFVGYNFASFNLLARLSPVGHAVGNSVKRVVMFGSGMFFLGEVMTGGQLTGTAVALAGVMMYNVSRTRK